MLAGFTTVLPSNAACGARQGLRPDASVSVFAGQSLGELVHQFLLALVFKLPRLVGVALHQFAQPFDSRISLLPRLTGFIEVILMPNQTLPLLRHGCFKLVEEVLVTTQPLP